MKTYIKCIKEPSANKYLLYPYKIGEKVILLERNPNTDYGTEEFLDTFVRVERVGVKPPVTKLVKKFINGTFKEVEVLDKTGVTAIGVIEVMSKSYFDI